MINHQFDLTELYVAKVLEEQLTTIRLEDQKLIDADSRQAIIKRILKEIPAEKRILQTVDTFPKQVSTLVSAKHKYDVSQSVWRALREHIETSRLTISEYSEYYIG